MTDDEILLQLTPVFREVFHDSTILVKPELTAADVDRWDSLSHIDMIMLVEEAFSIRVPTRYVTRMKNVGDLMRVIREQVKS